MEKKEWESLSDISHEKTWFKVELGPRRVICHIPRSLAAYRDRRPLTSARSVINLLLTPRRSGTARTPAPGTLAMRTLQGHPPSSSTIGERRDGFQRHSSDGALPPMVRH